MKELKDGADLRAQHTRLDVQGLRAVAVIAVMVCHAGLPLTGGFVGVDMFFVVSGFVITLMLLREKNKTGRIDLRRFYFRRIQRLAPGLAVVSSVSVVLALLFTTPDPTRLTLLTAFGATFAVGNAVIAATSGDYFGPYAERNWLLHTWSLSVEEQFYLVFPALVIVSLWVGSKWAPRFSKYVLLLAMLIVAAISVISIQGFGTMRTDYYPLGYYSSVTRAWEFLAGAVIAVLAGSLGRLPSALRHVAGILGALAVLASFLVIDSHTPFPGKWTMLPVAGTALLIMAGFGRGSVVSRILATRPMVAIGDWSYSLYLWHWPLIVLAQCVNPYSRVTPVIAVAVSFVPAYLSYRYVEQPIRHARPMGLWPKARLVIASVAPPTIITAACYSILISLILPAYAPGGTWHSRFETVQTPAQALVHLSPCSDELATFPMGVCETNADDKPRLLLIGDSHAEHLVPGLLILNPDLKLTVLSVRAPYPMGSPEAIRGLADYVDRHPEIQSVVFSGLLTRDQTGLLPEQVAGLPVLAKALASPDRRLFILNDGPTWPSDVFRCSYRVSVMDPSTDCVAAPEKLRPTQAMIDAGISHALDGIDDATVVDTYGAFCDLHSCRRATDDAPLYTDEHHLTPTGAALALEHAMRANVDFAAAVQA